MIYKCLLDLFIIMKTHWIQYKKCFSIKKKKEKRTMIVLINVTSTKIRMEYYLIYCSIWFHHKSTQIWWNHVFFCNKLITKKKPRILRMRKMVIIFFYSFCKIWMTLNRIYIPIWFILYMILSSLDVFYLWILINFPIFSMSLFFIEWNLKYVIYVSLGRKKIKNMFFWMMILYYIYFVVITSFCFICSCILSNNSSSFNFIYL